MGIPTQSTHCLNGLTFNDVPMIRPKSAVSTISCTVFDSTGRDTPYASATDRMSLPLVCLAEVRLLLLLLGVGAHMSQCVLCLASG